MSATASHGTPLYSDQKSTGSGPPLPAGYRNRPLPKQDERPAPNQSPLPEDWSEATKPIRKLAEALLEMIEEK